MQRGTRNSGACLKAQSPEGARQLVANYLHCASKKNISTFLTVTWKIIIRCW